MKSTVKKRIELYDKEKHEFKKINLENQEINKFKELKIENKRIAYFYKLNGDLKKSELINNCSTKLIEFIDTKENPPITRYSTFYCHQRFCPICIHKTSKAIFKLINDIVSLEENKDKSYLFLTLTVKNCKPDDLSNTVDLLLKAYNKLITNKTTQFAKRFLGVFRVLESTFNYRTGEFHPHIHCLVMVDKKYFYDTKKYLTKEKLIKIWQRVLNVDYLPSVDIRATYNTQSKTVAEVSKYTVKSSEIINRFTLKSYDEAFRKRQLRSFSGLFRKQKKQVLENWKKEKSDCYSYEKIMTDKSIIKNVYKWDCFKNEFILEEKNIKGNNSDVKKLVSEVINDVDYSFIDD